MSYQRIHQVLQADSMFAGQVTVKDTEVVMRNEKVLYPALVVNVYNALKTANCNLQAASKTTILAAAASLVAGRPLPVVATPPATQTRVKKASPAKPAAPPKPLQSTSKPVVVTTARAGAPRPPMPERPLDADVVHRYQCAVASAQLLAAVHQLFERDDYPGHESRKKKLDELISEVEQIASSHVNLSVKQIIRAQAVQTATQATG